MAGERIINRNPYLFGPGPVRRTPPPGVFTMYSRQGSPVKGFSLCAAHAVALGLTASLMFKFFVGDPQIKKIEDFYKENPPR